MTTVADALVDGLARAGTPRIFARGAVPAALAGAASRRGVPVVEAGAAAALMAAVTGEIGGAPGAAVVRLGDGAEPVREGLAHADRNHAPVILLTEPHPDAARLAPHVRASVVADASSAARVIADAARGAMADPRGPVHLVVGDAALAAASAAAVTACPHMPPPAADAASLDAAARALAETARPLLVVGAACAGDGAEWVRALAEALPAPVLATPRAKGAVPDPHPLALGLLDAGSPVLARATLLVAVGVEPGEVDAGAWPSAPPVVHVGRTRAALPSAPVVEVIGDIAAIVEELAPRLAARQRADWNVGELDRAKRALVAPDRGGFGARRAVRIARELAPATARAATDVPAGLAWEAVAPHGLVVPDGFATPGFALPAAIAVALAGPGPVFALADAASLLEPFVDLAAPARLGLPVVVLALDEGGGPADLVAAARAAGLAATAAESEAELRRVLGIAVAGGRPALVVARVAAPRPAPAAAR